MKVLQFPLLHTRKLLCAGEGTEELSSVVTDNTAHSGQSDQCMRADVLTRFVHQTSCFCRKYTSLVKKRKNVADIPSASNSCVVLQ